MSDLTDPCWYDQDLCHVYPSHWLFLTLVLTCFICWTLLEVMERVFGMAPKITNLSEIHDNALKDADNPVGRFIVNKRLTRSYYGNYRIQTRGTMYYIRFLWSGVMFIVAVTTILTKRTWFVNHVFYLQADTVYVAEYQHVSAAIIAFYIFELTANRYGKITWSIIIHHWLTIAAAMQVIWGFYSPFATWYGFTIISCTFPVDFALGLRATFSNRHPEITRKAFAISFYWWLGCLVLNISGQIFLIINALLPSHFNQSIHVSSVAIMLFAIGGWLYDDYQVLATLRDFATHDYADADILNKKHSHHTLRMKNTLGGRSLFGQGMKDEIDKHLGNELTPPPSSETEAKALKHVTMHNLKQTAITINEKPVNSPETPPVTEFQKIASLNSDDLNVLADIKAEALQEALKTPTSTTSN